MNLVLLGGPGSGKGTQAKALSEALRLTHVSTGALFRDEVARGTPLGVRVQDCINRGALVPDDITVAMLRTRLQRDDMASGAVFDGFPRTLEQAEALDIMLWSLRDHLDGVVYIDVPDDAIVERLAGRMVCRECEAPFHVVANPFSKCPLDKCHGEHLYRRDDDQPATVRARLEVFHRATQPLLEYYRTHGRLATIDGRGPVDDVARAMLDAVHGWSAHV